jgi:chaperonin GroEL (HSP60 family)
LTTKQWSKVSEGLSKMQTSLQEIDMLKTQIYEDFLRSIASVRAGLSSEVAFQEHERRVHDLRRKVAAAEETRPVRLRLVN